MDILISAIALLTAGPFLAIIAACIWLEDRGTPFYVAPRVSKGGGTFLLIKMRSMNLNAGRAKVFSTSENDVRLTAVGRFIRRYKMDEFPQFWNVLKGDMSLVGPRPQVQAEANLYTPVERRIFDIRPGITDLSSIVFADLGEILKDSTDANLAYNQFVRPWKSRLALLYVDHATFLTDLRLLWLTAVSFVARPRALDGVQGILAKWKADELVRVMAQREKPLIAYPPPGDNQVVMDLSGYERSSA